MFRACEAYANGAITGTGYSLLLSEINKTMVTLILAETAGARFGQAGAALGGTSSALASAKVEELTNMVNELETSQKEVSGAAISLEESAEKAATVASAATEDGQVTTPEAKAVEDANQDVDQDTQNLQDTVERLKRSGQALTLATSQISKAEGLGSLNVTPNSEVAAILASMQEVFLSEGKTQNYISACLVELGMGSEPIASLPKIVSDYRGTGLPGLLKKLEDLDATKLKFEQERAEIEDAIRIATEKRNAIKENPPSGYEDSEAESPQGSPTGGASTLSQTETNPEDVDLPNQASMPEKTLASLTAKLRSVTKKISTTEDSLVATQNQLNNISKYLSSSNLVEVQEAARFAIDDLAKGGDIGFGDLRAFVYRVYHLNRKTGLYSHCLAHLESVLDQVHDFRRGKLQHDVAIREKMVDAAVLLARSTEDSDATKFAFCHLLPDSQLRRECIVNLEKLAKPFKKPPVSSKPAVPPQNREMPPETDDLPKTIAIAQQDLNRLKTALPELVTKLTELDAFKGDKIEAPGHAQSEELEDAIRNRFFDLIKSQIALKKALLETSHRAHSIRSTVADHVVAAPNELNEILASYNAAIAQRDRADDSAQKPLDVRIESYARQADAIRLLTMSRLMELVDGTTAVSELIARIERHNAGVAAFQKA